MGGRVAAWTLIAWATACGGEVRNGEPTPPPPTTAQGSTPDPASPGGGSDTVPLADCKLGFLIGESAGRACVYVVSGRCYEKKLDACACACTKRSGTFCLNGFPEEDGTTKVTCD